MRVYSQENINLLFLSPYVRASIWQGGVLLEHRLSGESFLIMPKERALRSLWTGIHVGGDEEFWRELLQKTVTHKAISLEDLISKGYIE